jgi:MYXO-CTERM domain-containing protein
MPARRSPLGMKSGFPLLLLVSSLSLGACAAPQSVDQCGYGYGSCEAVTDLDARLMRAPLCVFVEVAPEDPCACEGMVTVINTCDYEVVAQNFSFVGSEVVIQPGAVATFEVVPADGPTVTAGEQEYRLVADGSEFEVVVDYGVVTEEGTDGGCSVSGAGRGSRSAGAWLAPLALAMYAARRRRRP